MYPLFESIRVEGGQTFLLDYHQDRVERSYHELYKNKCSWKLASMLPNLPPTGKHKLRFLYNENAFSFEIAPYKTKSISSLKLLEIDAFTYDLKFTDRSFLNNALDQRGKCDDVLLTRKGYLTDTTYCNVLLHDGSDWVTPAEPLFKGVQRQYLLDQKQIISRRIHIHDLKQYNGFQLVNALNPFDKNLKIPLDFKT